MVKQGAVRLVVVIFAALENLIHSGVIFGWPSLVYVLKDIGYYSNLCVGQTSPTNAASSSAPSTLFSNDSFSQNGMITQPTTSSTTSTSEEVAVQCSDQDAALVLVYTVATAILPMSALPTSILLLYGGTRLSRIIITLMMMTAYLCLAFSSPALPGLLYPTAIFSSVSGIYSFISTVEVANLFPVQKSTIIGILSGCYDTSSLVFLVVKVAYGDGVSLQVCSLVLAVSLLFFTVNTCLLPKDHIPWPLPDGYRLSWPWSKARASSSSHAEEGGIEKSELDNFAASPESKLRASYNSFNGTTQTTYGFDNLGYEVNDEGDLGSANPANGNSNQVPSEQNITKANEETPSPGRDEPASRDEEHAEKVRREEYPTVVSCFMSLMFVFLCVWAIISQLQYFFVLAIMNPWLTWLADGDTSIVSWYTDVFGLMTLVSLAFGPIGGMILDRKNTAICSRKTVDQEESYGPYTALYKVVHPSVIITVTSIIYGVGMCFKVLPLQYMTFTIFMISRAMFYSVSAAVVPVTFPMKYYGIIFGSMYLVIGLFGLLQYPLFIVIEDFLDGDPAYVMVGFIVANFVALIYPAYIIHYIKARTRQSSQRGKE